MINMWDIKWRLFDWQRASQLKIAGPDHNGDYVVNDQGTLWVVYSDGTRDRTEEGLSWDELKSLGRPDARIT